MLKIKYEYSGKEFELTPYNSNQEKDILLLITLDRPDISVALEICGMNRVVIDSLSDPEKISMLYKFRETSVGEEIKMTFICKKCNRPNENNLIITDTIIPSNIKNPLIIDQFKPVTEDNFHEFIKEGIDVDDMDLDDYGKLFDETTNTVTRFNFRKPIQCEICQETNYVKIDGTNFIIDNMSEDSLMSLYQTYNDLVFFGKYSKIDIDSMYPFERSILMGLLNKTREDLNNG